MKTAMNINIELNTALTFFSPETPKEVQKITLSNTSSLDLVKTITINKYFKTLILEILFERQDEDAFKFQQHTVEEWSKQITNGKNYIENNSSEDNNQWIKRINRCLRRQDITPAHIIFCGAVLQHLYGCNSESINTNLARIINSPEKLDLSGGLEDIYRSIKPNPPRDSFLAAVSPSVNYKIDVSLFIIQYDFYKAIQHGAFVGLIPKAASLTKEQLIMAVTLLDEALRYGIAAEGAENDLFNLIKQANSLPIELETLFINTVKDTSGVEYKFKSLRDNYSFKVLFLFANTKHPALLAQLTDIVMDRIQHDDELVRRSVYCWVNYIPATKNLLSGLIQAVIKEKLEPAAEQALKMVGSKLTTLELTKHIKHHLTYLDGTGTEEEKSQSCKIIGALASHLSPCPENIIQKLSALVGNNISYAATRALASLKLTPSIIKNDLIYKILDIYPTLGIEIIIQLLPSLSSSNITDEFIYNLVKDRFTMQVEFYKLRNESVSLLSQKLTETQLKTLIDYCLEKEGLTGIYFLRDIPSRLLKDNLEAIVKKYQGLLEDSKTRANACARLLDFQTLLPLFPKNFLLDFVKMLNDEDNSVSEAVSRALPKILHLIPNQHLTSVCELLLTNMSRSEKDEGFIKIRISACKCLGILTSEFSQEQILNVKEKLLIALEDKTDLKIRLKAFESLTKIAHRFSNEELTSLLILLANKSDSSTYNYIRIIAHLFTGASQDILLNSLLNDTENANPSIRAEAFLTLSSIAPYVSKEAAGKIIPKFIANLDNQKEDHKQKMVAIHGLIRLVEVMTKEELEKILNLDNSCFEIVVAQSILKTLYYPKLTDSLLNYDTIHQGPVFKF